MSDTDTEAAPQNTASAGGAQAGHRTGESPAVHDDVPDDPRRSSSRRACADSLERQEASRGRRESNATSDGARTPESRGGRGGASPGPGPLPTPKEHMLKTWAPFWDAVNEGRKTFELRRNDRSFRSGDVLVLVRVHEHAPHEPTDDPPRTLRRRVTYCAGGTPFGMQDGHVCLALGPEHPEERARHEAAETSLRNEAHAASLALEADLAARYEGVVADLRQRNADLERQLAALAERCGESCAAEIAELRTEADVLGDILDKTNDALGVGRHSPWQNIPDGVAHVCRSLAAERDAREKAEAKSEKALRDEDAARTSLCNERRAHEETRRERAVVRAQLAEYALQMKELAVRADNAETNVERLTEALRKHAVGPSDPRHPASYQSCKLCLTVWTHGERERHSGRCPLATVAPSPPEPTTVRQAARARQPLDGADAQALEGALAMTERERDEARREASLRERAMSICSGSCGHSFSAYGRPTVAGEPAKEPETCTPSTYTSSRHHAMAMRRDVDAGESCEECEGEIIVPAAGEPPAAEPERPRPWTPSLAEVMAGAERATQRVDAREAMKAGRNIWALAEAAQAEVDRWPAWKRRAADTALVTRREWKAPPVVTTADVEADRHHSSIAATEARAACPECAEKDAALALSVSNTSKVIGRLAKAEADLTATREALAYAERMEGKLRCAVYDEAARADAAEAACAELERERASLNLRDAVLRQTDEQLAAERRAHEETRRELEKAKRNTVTSTAFRRLFRTKEVMGAALRKEVAKLRASRDHALHMEGEMRSAVYEETARADMAERQRDEAREALAKAEERARNAWADAKREVSDWLIRNVDGSAFPKDMKPWERWALEAAEGVLELDQPLATTQPQTDPSTSATTSAPEEPTL